MNWLKYKQKYFFDGVKNYDEIDKALLFEPGYENIATLFNLATEEIIESEDFSDENIENICLAKLQSIDNEQEKMKFITSLNDFKAILGIKTNDSYNTSHNIAKPPLNDENNQLTLKEFISSGSYITQMLIKHGLSFDMAAEISHMLLEKCDVSQVPPLQYGGS